MSWQKTMRLLSNMLRRERVRAWASDEGGVVVRLETAGRMVQMGRQEGEGEKEGSAEEQLV